MKTVLHNETIAPNTIRVRIEAPRIAKKRLPGQFIIVRPTDESERIPLTIANADAAEGWIELIVQVVGAGTKELAHTRPGDTVRDLAGPLGKPTHITNVGHCVCIGGGVGIAPLYPIVCGMKEAGNTVTTIIGARNKDTLILEKEMKEASDALYVATDDGSYGHHGFVSDVFTRRVKEGDRFDQAVVIGPAIMMKVTSALTLEQGVPTIASLNPIMVDGTGMCGGCRVTVNGETRFACVDGPEFDAAGIDWDELIKRLATYEHIEQTHSCKITESVENESGEK